MIDTGSRWHKLRSPSQRWVYFHLAFLMLGLVPSAMLVASDAADFSLLTRAEHVATIPAREPMVVRHPGGELFLTGYWRYQDPNSELQLWRSSDEGNTWQAVDVGTPASGARGNSDVDLAVGPEGALYFVTMGFDRQAIAGTHITVGVSTDVGETWRWTVLSQDRGSDRPWVSVAPNGDAHIVWNDGRGVRHAVSDDLGVNWREMARISDVGGSSHFAIGPAGELAVRITPLSASAQRYDVGVDRIAISRDGGLQWKSVAAPGHRAWVPDGDEGDEISRGNEKILPRWVEPVAWDDKGALYSLWSEGERVMLARSKDAGEHWDQWALTTTESNAHYPYLIVRNDGEFAASWFSGEGADLAVQLVHGHAPEKQADPAVLYRALPFAQRARSGPRGDVLPVTAGEYLPLVFLSENRLAVAAVMQDALKLEPGVEVLGAGPQGFEWRTYKLPVESPR